ncbi:MAG: hypothetical protein PUP46_00240 [Endozoicomonas sp. (ex Botrylloides leachii)]|nr:hypothetical protein [Endozoicomonas sp. (ex Botrylloides leachii)]
MGGILSLMATNGESATQWLNDNHGKVSIERIQQIIRSISQKIARLTPEHPEYDGLIAALDVMNEYKANISPDRALSEPSLTDLLDASPLVPEVTEAKAMHPEEKKRRFQQLLKKSDM